MYVCKYELIHLEPKRSVLLRRWQKWRRRRSDETKLIMYMYMYMYIYTYPYRVNRSGLTRILFLFLRLRSGGARWRSAREATRQGWYYNR